MVQGNWVGLTAMIATACIGAVVLTYNIPDHFTSGLASFGWGLLVGFCWPDKWRF